MKKAGFEVIRDLCGHGVGVKVHESPYIYNFPHKDLKHISVQNNMAFAIEPITAVKSTKFVEEKPGSWELLCEK
jgi:methionyl aminopeptidase